MTSVPSWYPDGVETKPAPEPLLRVQALLNTEDWDLQTDRLDDRESARAWFESAGLLAPGTGLRPAELAFARALRESVRALLASHASDEPAAASELEPLRELTRTHQPRLDLDERGHLVLDNPKHAGLRDGLFDLVLIIRTAQEDGTWGRLKACANDDCGWVFYDRSRNQQGNWCDMAVCGNRLKNRRLRARQR